MHVPPGAGSQGVLRDWAVGSGPPPLGLVPDGASRPSLDVLCLVCANPGSAERSVSEPCFAQNENAVPMGATAPGVRHVHARVSGQLVRVSSPDRLFASPCGRTCACDGHPSGSPSFPPGPAGRTLPVPSLASPELAGVSRHLQLP